VPSIVLIVLPFLQIIFVVDGALETTYLISAIFSDKLSDPPCLNSPVQFPVEANPTLPLKPFCLRDAEKTLSSISLLEKV
jgi:hypothetical protein